jgi:DNA helicase-2/ATP-dependent DNA helicase PcrA
MECYKLFGPPGTGKTTKMLKLLENELDQGVEPAEIVYLSFTRVAVGEARSRAKLKFPQLSDEDLHYFRTMHSMAYRVLGLLPSRVAQGEALFDFGQTAGYPFEKTKKFVDADDIMFGDSTAGGDVSLGSYLLSIWDFIRNNLWSLDEGIRQYPQMISHPKILGRADLVFKDFVKKYETWKADSNLLDFTDFLLRVLKYHRPLWPPVQTIFADEVQDFSPLQWQVLRLWASPAHDGHQVRLFLAGDDDQAIFTFQGATPQLFLEHQGVEKVLERSWRLPRAVWEYSQRLILRNHNRRVKEFSYNAEGGQVNRVDRLADLIAPIKTTARGEDGSWFLLARNRFLLDQFAERLEKDFIPYTNKRGWSPFDNKKLMQACEVAIRFKDTGAATLGELNSLVSDHVESTHISPDGSKQVLVVRGGKKQLEEKSKADPNSIVTRFEAATFGLTPDFFNVLDFNPIALVKFKSLEHKEYISNSFESFGPQIFKTAHKITLSTMHGVKGEEADNVVLCSDVSNSCYRNMMTDPEAERRVFYVGATRAKSNLFLMAPQTSRCYPL